MNRQNMRAIDEPHGLTRIEIYEMPSQMIVGTYWNSLGRNEVRPGRLWLYDLRRKE